MEGNLLVQDEEILVSKSPFSAFPAEKMIYDGRISPISIEHIMLKVKRGHVYGADFVILEALSELEFATSRMVTQYLNLKNIDISQSKVSNRLKFMNKTNIISRFKFESDEGKLNVKAYCLERAGKYLLLSRNYKCYWKMTDNTRPIQVVKKILARNQVLLSYRTKIPNVLRYSINPRFKLLKSNSFFNPSLKVDLKHGEEQEYILFEIFRGYDGFEDEIGKKMKQYEEFYEYFTPTVDLPRPPQLIIVGEDDKHLFEIFKILFKKNLKLKDVSYIYTTDLRVLDVELNKSVVQFTFIGEDGKKKAKIKVLDYTVLK